ncbi:MAG: peptidoglycan-associated lipoprotein [Piscirickettsiaceae bacterium CG_4_9_14_3_um_filter_43_564]|nr:peptidoglycan-associated lipoprotein Pal [Thiomicrospira sp.]PIQ03105.1 MAG: peptidoglycan-associated lipoprotein [Piscirickettsiaceae bacterium CG18_big_fil_WC_8_21_14_2_50_44_103]PIU39624.1 MAG: peptidoglycan-associated lipoprotein [Piscirickettsiaceae bacterium CG07_land_8_20_14_0_80_44_28]PIW57162.1 MAG: peptidoglycan-associated lipoprotein [Piscirickettsiaceae bacterium CG12_big_fil_rev_8_21_14_0_65_44_934]PIW77318.1 MAG: peptidoglycan-associated lipoprotein [Piscirickettsiaceae bacteri
MSLSGLKQLFFVGILGVTLVGCSSTPSNEDSASSAAATQTNEDKAAAEAEAAKLAAEEAEAAKLAEAEANAVPTNAAGMTADDLFAALQGKVVNFEFDRSEVRSEFYNVIKLNADYMALNSRANITIEGHCDERGTREYNLALGERRANAVKNALIAEGISPSRISVISYGEERPVDAAHNERAWSKNRRAEFNY